MQRLTRGGARAPKGSRASAPLEITLRDGSIFGICLEAHRAGVYVGHLRARRFTPHEPFTVRDVYVVDAARRSGVASALYARAARYGELRSFPDLRDGSMSSALWETFVAQGDALRSYAEGGRPTYTYPIVPGGTP